MRGVQRVVLVRCRGLCQLQCEDRLWRSGYKSASLHGVTSCKTAFFIATAVRAACVASDFCAVRVSVEVNKSQFNLCVIN
jgi:hypothetical protein